MKDPELQILIETLEARHDVSDAEMDGVLHALAFLLPKPTLRNVTAHRLTTVDGVLQLLAAAYPAWSVDLHGRAVAGDGQWRCILRPAEGRDDADAGTSEGRAPSLCHAILVCVLRLSMAQGARGAMPET